MNCERCDRAIEYDFSQKLSTDDWKEFQGADEILTEQERNLLGDSFVFIDNDKEVTSLELAAQSPPKREKSNDAPIANSLCTQIATDLSRKIETAQKLSDIANGLSQINHPMCTSCVATVVEKLDKELNDLNEERAIYTEYLKELTSDGSSTQITAEEQSKLDKENKDLDDEIADLEKELLEIRSQKATLQNQKAYLDQESQKLDGMERQFCVDANKFWVDVQTLHNEHAHVGQRIREVTAQVETMKKTNVFDDAFRISFNGIFGTINGLRLGRLPSDNVKWEEINAGLGQACLLLDVLAKQCGKFKFRGYTLRPTGSYSEVIRRQANGKDERAHLYQSSGGYSLFSTMECEKGLEWFLECIHQLQEHAISLDSNFKMYYKIVGHKIGTNKEMYSVKHKENRNKNADECWTKALKYMLIDLRYLLAWVSKFYPI